MRLSTHYSRWRLGQRMFAGLVMTALWVGSSFLLAFENGGTHWTVADATASNQQPLATEVQPRDLGQLPTIGHGMAPLPPVGNLPAAASPAVYDSPSACSACPGGAMSSDYGLMTEDGMYGECLSADCGLGCPKTWYARFEMLSMERISYDGHSLSYQDPDGLPGLGYQPGGRITVGRIRDCLDGIEFAYTGVEEWDSFAERLGPGLYLAFDYGWFPPGINIEAFRDADVHRQYRSSSLHSAEINWRKWGWDVISTSCGLRYLFIGEDFLLESVDSNGDIGIFDFEANNYMIGPQLGVEFYVPLGRLRSTLKFDGAIFANFASTRRHLINAGVTEFLHGDDHVEFGWLGEIGYFLNYQLLPRVSIQGGYELWYVGTTTLLLTRNHGRNNDVEDIFYHGASAGVEIVW